MFIGLFIVVCPGKLHKQLKKSSVQLSFTKEYTSIIKQTGKINLPWNVV